MLFNDKIYKILKWLVQYFFPAFGTLYFALAAIWGLPYGEQVVGTTVALTLFVSTLLGISTSAYNKSPQATDGTLQIDSTNPAQDTYRFEFNGELRDLADKRKVIFAVKPNVTLSE